MTERYQRLDDLFDNGKCSEVLAELEKDVEGGDSNIETLWRLARCQFETGTGKPKDEQKEWYEKSYATALKGIEADATHYGGFKWAGISLGFIGDFVGAKEMIGNAFKIREYFDTADSITEGTDPTVKHAIGKWCYKIANIGFLERTAASALFATPPNSSFEEALEYFLGADKMLEGKLKFVGVCSSNYLLTGLAYEGLKDTDNAKIWFQKCIDLPVQGAAPKTQEDNKETARQRIAAIGSSWW